jgi:hypothetical protein
MFKKIRLEGALTAAFAVAFCLSGTAAAQDRDAQEAASYKLTEVGLANYAKASGKLAELPSACDEDEEDSDVESIDGMVAKLNSLPGAQAAIQSAGMTSREYVVFTFAMLQAGIAAWGIDQGGKLPAGMSQANIDFYRKHADDLKQIEGMSKCEEEPDEEPFDE